MKKIALILVVSIVVGLLAGCSSETESKKPTIDTMQIRNICKLATLECYYHNVAKSVKKAGAGISHIGEKDRDFWVEYTGIAKLGIDMTKLDIEVDGLTVYITLPPAEIIGISIDKDSLSKESYIVSGDGINRNKITADDQTSAINEAQLKMVESVENNKSLLLNAQNRARILIENYVQEMGEAFSVEYNIVWKYANADGASQISTTEDGEDAA